MGKNLFKYKLENLEDVTASTFYTNFLKKEGIESRSGRTIYILISEISFNMVFKIATDISNLNNDLRLVVIFNEKRDVRNLIKKFMNNIFEGSESTKGKYAINANTLVGMTNRGMLEFKIAESKYHLNVICGHTLLLGMEKLSLDPNFSNGYVFWEDYEEYTAEVKTEVTKIYNASRDANEIIKLLKYTRKDYKASDMYYLMLLNIFQVQEYTSEQSEIKNMRMNNQGLWKCLFEFQRDGVYGLIHRLNKNGFALLADSVGLGKTYQALAVIQYFQEKKGEKTLVLSPIKLFENWNNEIGNQSTRSFDDVQLFFDVHFHTTITNKKTPGGTAVANVDYTTYDMLVIDEAHAFKNSKSKRYLALMNKILSVNPRIKILLLSATPVSNTLKDLESLINLMSKGARTIGAEPNKIDYKKMIRDAERKLDLSLEPEAAFYSMLDEVLVSRDKAYVKDIYQNSNLKFPEKSESVSLTVKSTNEEKKKVTEFYEEISNMTYAMYDYYHYLREDRKEYFRSESLNISERSQGMKVLMRMLLLKRYESTHKSLITTINKMVAQMKQMQMIENNNPVQHKVNILENKTNDILEENGEEGIELPYENLRRDDFTPEFFTALNEDISILESIINNKIYADISSRKIELLIAQVNELLELKEKVIIFTSYSDTAEELADKLFDVGIEFGLVTGNTYKIYKVGLGNKSEYEKVLKEFSPKSKRNNNVEHEIDVLIATDVISEGQNLQDCSNIINFDVHWNPVRIIQRLGRIDRLNSEHEYINNYIFWPFESIEVYLNMKERLDKKNRYIHAVGAEGYEYESDYNTTKEQLEQVANGIDIEENKIQLSSKEKSKKKFELDYKRIKNEIDPDSQFFNVIDYISELRGLNTYVLKNEITTSSYLLYRTSSKEKLKSELFPYILVELDVKGKIKFNQIESLEVIRDLYEESILQRYTSIDNNIKKELFTTKVKPKLTEITYALTKKFEGIKLNELSLIASIYVLSEDAVEATNYNRVYSVYNAVNNTILNKEWFDKTKSRSYSKNLDEHDFIHKDKANTIFDNIEN